MDNSPSLKRFFSDIYDSVQQRNFPIMQQLEGINESDVTDLWIGRMRFDSLISRKIVLTDAQLLDGCFFAHVDPSKLLRRLQRGYNDEILEIKARSEDLEEAILGFVKKRNSSNLSGFSFSLILDTSERSEVVSMLKNTKAEAVSSLQDLESIFENSNVERENIERIMAAWRQWIEVAQEGKLGVSRWQGSFDLDIALGSLDERKRTLQTDEGKSIADWVYKNRYNRSAIDIYLNEQQKLSRGEQQIRDIKKIEGWLNRAYNLALSWQHNCDNFESVYDLYGGWEDTLKEGEVSVKPFESNLRLSLPSNFIIALGKMEDSLYRDLFSRKRNFFYEWWKNGNSDDLRRAFEPFAKEIITNRYALILKGKKVISEVMPMVSVLCFNNHLLHIIIGGVYIGLFTIEKVLSHSVKKTTQRIVQLGEERRDVQKYY